MKKNLLKKSPLAMVCAGIIPALLLSACGEKENISTEATVSKTAANESAAVSLALQPLTAAAEQATFTAEGWLSVHPDLTMQLTDESQTLLNEQQIAAEFISERSDENGPLFVSIDTEENRLVSYRVTGNEITGIQFGETLPYPVEGLCLYQPSDNELNVFVMDEAQMAHQLLLDVSADAMKQQEIRQFPLPPLSEYCVVDDATDQLFVSEENVGVWAYNARAESEVARKPVDLVQPWGSLNENAGPLALANGQLLIAELGTNQLHSYRIEKDNYTLSQSWTMPADMLADSLTASSDGGHIAILDDESGTLFTGEISLPPRAATAERIAQLAPSAETTPVTTNGDAADDPAIWVNSNHPEQSRVLGTNKKQGLYVYDLKGNELQELLVGRVNNVDVRQGFTYQGKATDIAAASQRDRHAIALFTINPANGQVSTAGEVETTLDDVYGMCMYKNNADEFFVFINDEDGRFEQWQITDSDDGWKGKKVREFAVETQPEGCAADDVKQRLFIGEEDVAVWTLGAEPDDATELTELAPVSDILVDDIEGMDVYRQGDQAYLIVSSQGNDSYILYNAEAPYDYIGRFRVGINAAAGIDGASETDGLTVTSANLGDDYPAGMLVVQDGRNMLPDELQNFKYVNWKDIADLMNL